MYYILQISHVQVRINTNPNSKPESMVTSLALVGCTVVLRNQTPVPTPDLHAFVLCVADTVNEQFTFFNQKAVQATPEE